MRIGGPNLALGGGGNTPFEPNATVALDFRAKRYRVGAGAHSTPDFASLAGLTVTRASVGYAETSGGLLVPFSSNQARITDKGLLVEEARTNKCRNTNVNPSTMAEVAKSGDAAATLTLVDDSAALAAIGLTGNVFKLDNSAGTTNAFALVGGPVGNTSAHTISGYARGSGNFRFDVHLGTGPSMASTALTSSYVRYSATGAPSDTTAAFRVWALPGAVVYFILNQLEEGGFITSPIRVAGVAATRPADNISIASLSLPAAFTVVGQARTPPALVTSWSPSIAAFSDNTNNNTVRLLQSSAGGAARGIVTTAGVSQADISLASVAADTVLRAALRAETDNVGFSAQGSAPTVDTTATLPAAVTTLTLGTRAPVPGQVDWWCGYIHRIALYPRAFSAAELQAATI